MKLKSAAVTDVQRALILLIYRNEYVLDSALIEGVLEYCPDKCSIDR